MKEKKITLYILLGCIILLGIIVIPFVISSSKQETKKNFPDYNDVDISKGKLENDLEYENIRSQLENDYYFAKLTIMDDYDSKNYNPVNLQKMVWNFIFNYELSNKNYFTYSDSKKGIYCLSKDNFLKAFKELYDVDISKNLNLLKGYYKYVYINSKGYCFDFKNVSNEYNKDIKIAIDRMSMLGTTITTDVYVYEYFNIGNENDSAIKLLNKYINNKNYIEAKKIV